MSQFGKVKIEKEKVNKKRNGWSGVMKVIWNGEEFHKKGDIGSQSVHVLVYSF